jgi:hypothetical protein
LTPARTPPHFGMPEPPPSRLTNSAREVDSGSLSDSLDPQLLQVRLQEVLG